ncbi:ferredoxin [Haloparvum sp. AD34]
MSADTADGDGSEEAVADEETAADDAAADTYTVAVDRDACDGVFACLVRDDRFREDDDGLAGFDPETADALERSEASVQATFTDDRLEDARAAAAACPFDAITVETQ